MFFFSAAAAAEQRQTGGGGWVVGGWGSSMGWTCAACRGEKESRGWRDEWRGEEAWRGSRQLADFANPSFLSVKPSSEARGQSRASPYARLNAHFTGSAPIQPTGEPVD